MKKIINFIITNSIIILSLVFLAYNFMPLSWFEIGQKPVLGVSVTTIQGTDTLSASRTTINNNFTTLLAGVNDFYATTTLPKITSLPALATVGTITSGTWNGTLISVAKGGTGSTTLSAYQVLIGSSTNAVDVVKGLGTSGQFLTSQGPSQPPIWSTSAIDTGIDYTWTGAHTFNTATTTIGSSLLYNPTYIRLNGVDYRLPSTAPASSTVATVGPNSTVVWQSPKTGKLAELIAGGASTTIAISDLPPLSDFQVVFETPDPACGSPYATANLTFNGDIAGNYNYDSILANLADIASSSVKSISLTDSQVGSNGAIWSKIDITNSPTLTKKVLWSAGYANIYYYGGAGNWTNTSNAITKISISTNSASCQFPAGARLTVYGFQ